MKLLAITSLERALMVRSNAIAANDGAAERLVGLDHEESCALVDHAASTVQGRRSTLSEIEYLRLSLRHEAARRCISIDADQAVIAVMPDGGAGKSTVEINRRSEQVTDDALGR